MYNIKGGFRANPSDHKPQPKTHRFEPKPVKLRWKGGTLSLKKKPKQSPTAPAPAANFVREFIRESSLAQNYRYRYSYCCNEPPNSAEDGE